MTASLSYHLSSHEKIALIKNAIEKNMAGILHTFTRRTSERRVGDCIPAMIAGACLCGGYVQSLE